jgi:hypothetical protein
VRCWPRIGLSIPTPRSNSSPLRCARITGDNTNDRAEHLRRAMLALIDGGEPREAHLSAGAPFIVVGEGAR